MCILKCCYPLTLFMNIADIFIGHVSEAQQQVIYLKPPFTVKFPTRQWLGNDAMTQSCPNGSTAMDTRES